jgi:hypothetical protein
LLPRNKFRLLGEQKNTMFEEQILYTWEQQYCVRGIHPIYSGNNNIASEEHISSTWGTQILCSRNKYRILRNTNIAFEEHIPYTQGTRILLSRNKFHLLGEQKNTMFEEQILYNREQQHCVRGIHPIYSGNNNIASEEHISSSRGTKILCSRNKYRILGNKNIAFEKHIPYT